MAEDKAVRTIHLKAGFHFCSVSCSSAQIYWVRICMFKLKSKEAPEKSLYSLLTSVGKNKNNVHLSFFYSVCHFVDHLLRELLNREMRPRVKVYARDGSVGTYSMTSAGTLGMPGVKFMQNHGGPASGSTAIPKGDRLHCTPSGCSWGRK
eukprot:TRINITY_DN665_c0_g1_i2.p1 TRINITY_DN665_c0_g1~~TRINITY_DN665_c0_g1_i2.p1  ORF type:complete len:150 (+),score=16.50 TRINITY_DN665_c0_g1_i2:181-630(+)